MAKLDTPKDPKSRGKPQSVAIYQRGVAGCELWFKRWRRTVSDVEQAEWAYRDFNGWVREYSHAQAQDQ